MISPPRGRRLVAAAIALAIVGAGCSTGGGGDRETGDRANGPDRSTTSSSSTSTTVPPPKLVEYDRPPGTVVGTQPDGFVVTKLPPGAKPPQFVVVSFDGAGWHEKWRFWRKLQERVPFHFTGFLSGTYLLSEQSKDHYTGPGHSPGRSSLAWTEPKDVPVEIDDLNEALRRGDEIGTHFNGHFCSGAEPSVGTWNTDQWNDELDQFDSFITDVQRNNGIDDRLDLKPSDVTGARTPCLEGDPGAMFPAYQAHGLVYDSSVPRDGLAWPTQSPQLRIWQMGMALFPMHGTDRPLITMDYNFYYRQRNANSDGVTAEQSKADSAVVLGTYRDMYHAAVAGNRAPLILGNHFNEWNNGAYQNAMADFVRETCGKADTYCIPFRDLVAWIQAQDLDVIAHLQGLPPELAVRP